MGLADAYKDKRSKEEKAADDEAVMREHEQSLAAQHKEDEDAAPPPPPPPEEKRSVSAGTIAKDTIGGLAKAYIDTNPVTAPIAAGVRAVTDNEEPEKKPLVFPKAADPDARTERAQPTSNDNWDPGVISTALAGPTGGHGSYESSTTTPERENALNEAYDEGEHLAGHQGYAEAAAEGEKGAAEEGLARAQSEGAEQIRGDATDLLKEGREQNAYQQKALDDLLKQPGVDPDRLWNSKSTASKIGTQVAAMLSGFAMGWNHEQGPNPVIKGLREDIANDIAAQEDSFKRKEKGWERQSQLFAHAYALTGDYNQARKLATDMGIQSVTNHVKAVEHTSAQPVIKAHAAQLVNDLEREKIVNGIKMHPMVQAAAAKGIKAEDIVKRVQHIMDASRAVGKPIPAKDAYRQVFAEYGMDTGTLYDNSKPAKPGITGTQGMANAVAHDRDTIDPNGLRESGTVDDSTNVVGSGGHLENLNRFNRYSDVAKRIRADSTYNRDFASMYRGVAKLRGNSKEMDEALGPSFLLNKDDTPEIKAEKLKRGEEWQKANAQVIDSLPPDTETAPAEETPSDFQEDQP